MSDWIDIQKDEKHIARERNKARELRKSSWWRSLLDKGECHYCHGKFKPEELSMDHVVPVARGGKSVKGNIVPCCKECNNRKKYMTPAEMIMEQLDRESRRISSTDPDPEVE
ncbi:MAG: HNH endonuclease [Lentisphaeria bacterium]|nr:HNH endonuclease [Lentisphaeria bacterium]